MTMKQRSTIVWAGSIGSLVLGLISGLVLSDQTATFRVSMIFSVAAALLNIFAVPFFLIGLKRFKPELRQTYLILCVGIVVFGLAQVQLPLVNLYNATFWVDSGAIAIPYLIGVICIFWSMRSLSHLLGIKSLWRSGSLALLATVLISLAASFLPHVKVVIDEMSYHISLTLSIWNSVFITFAAILAFKIRQNIGLSYVNAMNWLFRALAVLSFAGWHYSIEQLLATVGNWYYDYSIAVIPFVAGALALVIAGFTFDLIDTTQDSVPVPPPTPASVPMPAPVPDVVPQPLKSSTVLSPAQELEVILYVANLVSIPSDINALLERIRIITSKIQPGQVPSSEDQKALDLIYVKLEDYLLHRDPLRVFTQEELRSRIIKRFGLSSSVKTTLWHQSQ